MHDYSLKPKIALSDHYDGKYFFNPPPYKNITFKDVAKWLLNRKRKTWTPCYQNISGQYFKIQKGENFKVTMINHSSLLIETNLVTILTDPIYSDRTGPFAKGPKRIHSPGIAFENLPPIDLVLISHNHYDHFDSPTLKSLQQKFNPTFVVPLANAKLLNHLGISNTIELDWWQQFQHKGNMIILTPAQHWSSRWPWDKQQTLWGGFYLQLQNIDEKHIETTSIFFCGDSGYGNHFKTIKEKLGAPLLALLPIGASKPRSLMKLNHMNALDAKLAKEDLAAKWAIPMHFETFQLADEEFGFELKSWQENNTNAEEFLYLKPGASKAWP